MRPSVLPLVTFLLTMPLVQAKTSTLCSDAESGAFVGLAIDEDSYLSVEGGTDVNHTTPQKWTLTMESAIGPKHSFKGQFLQVLPDEGRTYPGRGVHLAELTQLENNSPYVAFRLRVDKGRAGWHTLFLRWTGGDTQGGGDSLFVTMQSLSDKKPVVSGQRALKPLKVPIESSFRNFAGCCYSMVTHACPCVQTTPAEDDKTCSNFVPRNQAAEFGAQCSVGPGVMEFVDAPQWYLYAGQEVGDVMDFDAEPWDATCEAEGSNTADSGRDYASWNLKDGDYELRIYAREDGTALDAVYVAGPRTKAPGLLMRYGPGESTFCKKEAAAGSLMSTFGFVFLSALVTGLLVVFLRSPLGTEVWHRVPMMIARAKGTVPGSAQVYQDLQFRESI